MEQLKTIDLVRDVLEKEAPDELLLLDDYSPRKQQGAVAGGPLGFGAEAAVALLLPVVWKIVEAYLMESVKEAGKQTAAVLVKMWRDRSVKLEVPAPPSPELLANIQQQLVANGVELTRHPNLALTIAQTMLTAAA